MEEEDYRTTYELEERNWWFAGMRRICVEWIDRCLATQGDASAVRILDVGCGTGINLEVLADRGSATGVDRSDTALDFCRSRGLRSLARGRGEALPFPDATFALVGAIGVVEHIEADLDALREWTRVVRPGGDVVVLTSAYRWMWSGHDVSNHHVRRYRVGEVRALLEAAGLEQVRASYANTVLTPPIAVVRMVDRLRRRGRAPAPHKDTGEVPAIANRALQAVLAAEARWLRRRDLPFGVSIVASGRRPLQPSR